MLIDLIVLFICSKFQNLRSMKRMKYHPNILGVTDIRTNEKNIRMLRVMPLKNQYSWFFFQKTFYFKNKSEIWFEFRKKLEIPEDRAENYAQFSRRWKFWPRICGHLASSLCVLFLLFSTHLLRAVRDENRWNTGIDGTLESRLSHYLAFWRRESTMREERGEWMFRMKLCICMRC